MGKVVGISFIADFPWKGVSFLPGVPIKVDSSVRGERPCDPGVDGRRETR